MATYTELKAVDTKAELVKDLIRTSNARLSHAVIQKILDWSFDGCEGWGEFDVPCLASQGLELKVLNAREFGNALRLQDYEMSHSWAGDDKIKEFGFVVLGDARFGLAKNHSYYNNGDYAGGEEITQDGEFDLNQVQVVLINQEISDHYNNNCRDEDNWILAIYLPESQLLDEETYELGRKFGFLGKLA